MNRAMHLRWLLAALACAMGASAQTVTWNNSAGGSYDTAGNWTPSGIPGSGANLEFNLNSSYQVTLPGGRPAPNMFVHLVNVPCASYGALPSGLIRSQPLDGGTGLLTHNDAN